MKTGLVIALSLAGAALAQERLIEVRHGVRTNARATTSPSPALPSWLKPEEVRYKLEALWVGLRHRELGGLTRGAHLIPGLKGPCTPQGIAVLPDGRVALTYHVRKTRASGPAGAVLAVLRDGALEMVRELVDVDGKPLKAHVGGLACAGGRLWTGGAGRLLAFPLPTGTERWLSASRAFDVDSTVSSVSAEGNTVWVADFYRDDDATKDASRRWAAAYAIDPESGDIVTKAGYMLKTRRVLKPDRVIALPAQVQGFAVCGDRVALSQSHGHSDGALALYANPLAGASRAFALPDGSTVPAHALGRAVHTVSLPCGPEDLEWNGATLYLAFESGAQEYRDAWRRMGGNIEDRWLELSLPRQ